MARRNANLTTYRKKRNFDVTSEPAPSARPKRGKSAAPTFMVHKHDATRLHYDLRLEMDEALASWAIPKGPSYDPAQKRLAVQTEDHPLAYGDFEGRIPDGEYGGGDSIVWDRGTYDTLPPGQASEQRKKGRLHIKLAGEKLQGEWDLVRTRMLGKKQQWLCIKAHDGTERADYDVVAERPESVKTGKRVTRGPLRKKTLHAAHPSAEVLVAKVWPPMKATLSTADSASAQTHVFEVKYDGFRAVAALSGGNVVLQSRNEKDFATRFPTLPAALARLKVAEAVFDGEIVAVDAKGVSHFQDMQDASVEHRYVIFDLLWLDGEDLRQRPLEERRELLESVLSNVKLPLQLSERVDDSTEAALAVARKRGWEGLIAKRRASTYENRRSEAWLKLKVLSGQELAIVGYTPISNGGKQIGSLLLGVNDEQGLRYAGKVGTGFSSELRSELYATLRKLEADEPTAAGAPRMKDAHWVKPKLVAQIQFTEWTRDGRLRHPAFQGLRDDKSVAQVTREQARHLTRAKTGKRRAPAAHASRTAKPRPPAQAPAAEVTITHPDRVVFPDDGITKAQIAAYYAEVAPLLMKALADRPLSFQAWPRGTKGPSYFRHDAGTAPEFITTAAIEHDQHVVNNIVVDSPQTVAWLANQSALTLHMCNARIEDLQLPDWVAFDLDPGQGGWESLVPLAHALHGLLEELKLKSIPKTSGKRGLHVLVPVAHGTTHEQVLDFAVKVTSTLAQKFSDVATTLRSIAPRHGRLYLDAHQNGYLKTLVAPYSLRAIPGAPVSTPVHWDEVTTKLDPSKFNLKTLVHRLEKVGDLFAPALEGKQRLPRLA